MRVVFLSLECADPLFSGNGTYSRSLVNSLLHHKIPLFVLSASPGDTTLQYPKEWSQDANFKGRVVQVPKEKWFRHDINSSWSEFAEGVGSNANLQVEIREFGPDVIIGVDWSSLLPYKTVSAVTNAPFVYLNFRVFHTNLGIPEEEKNFYREREYEACMIAAETITLSPFDTNSLHVLTGKHVITILPPLPRKIHTLALAYQPSISDSNPKYLLCCVRLSREKNVQVFIDVCRKLSQFLTEKNIVPYMCGAAQSPEYAGELRQKLQEAHPASLFFDIMSHEALVEVYKKSVLNFHPALYEAYGLTIVEAAAFGTPSIVHEGGGIGATALLQEKNSEEMAVFYADMGDSSKATEAVRAILSDEPTRVAVAACAKTKSLSYGEAENGEQFVKQIEKVVKSNVVE